MAIHASIPLFFSTPVSLPREFQGQRSLADYSPWGCKQSDTAALQPSLIKSKSLPQVDSMMASAVVFTGSACSRGSTGRLCAHGRGL